MHPSIDLQFAANVAYESILWGGVGYIIGHLADTSPEACAGILAVSSIAKTIFSFIVGYAAKNLEDYKSMCTFSNYLTETITLIFMMRQKLLNADLTTSLWTLSTVKAILLS